MIRAREIAYVLPLAPSELFPGLFESAWGAGLFPAVKQWADAVYKAPPAVIMAAYQTEAPATPQELKHFVERFFEAPPIQGQVENDPGPGTPTSLEQHLADIWQELTRQPDRPSSDSLLPLPRPYLVPGGMFREIYYWDTYFTSLGITRDRPQLVQDMADNLSHLIDRFGFVPNGNRTYYLTRSQPPFFHVLVQLLVEHDGNLSFADYLPQLEHEYAFWMDGAPFALTDADSPRRCVAMPHGGRLNRYWDENAVPRDEAYGLDVTTAAAAGADSSQIYRDIRAAAESGWDFSSRWFADHRTLATVETTSIIPVDLNAILFGLETTIAGACASAGRSADAAAYTERACARRMAAQKYLWCVKGYFSDFNLRTQSNSDQLTAATVYPLFFGMATQHQADQVAAVIQARLLAQGGIVATLRNTGEQWDSPNGWAPLQWLAVCGLEKYGHHGLAKKIATAWVGTVSKVYSETGKVLEKYDVVTVAPGGGGEYPLQDGFGWTNGVVIALIDKFPELSSFTNAVWEVGS